MNKHEKDAMIFKAFCDPKRLAILEQLRSGEKCACKLLAPMDLSQSGLSYHMKILTEAGIVLSRQEGKWTHYRLNGQARETLPALLTRLITENDDADDTNGCCGK